MKLTNVLKIVGAGVGITMMVGCASVGSAGRGTVSNTKNGILYGYASTDIKASAKQLCDAIQNSDERCVYSGKYQSVTIIASHGFNDGGYGVMALADANLNIDR